MNKLKQTLRSIRDNFSKNAIDYDRSIGFTQGYADAIRAGQVMHTRNVLWMPDGLVAPRSQDNLKKLHQYVRREFGRKNIFDRRTKAYKYLRLHDSEVAHDDK